MKQKEATREVEERGRRERERGGRIEREAREELRKVRQVFL
jgi:hypothetical protein